MMNWNHHTIFASITILIGIGFGVMPVFADIDTDTYRSDKRGFSIDYPQKWNVNETYGLIQDDDEFILHYVTFSHEKNKDVYLRVAVEENDSDIKNLTDKEYLSKMINDLKFSCKHSKLTTGNECYDFEVNASQSIVDEFGNTQYAISTWYMRENIDGTVTALLVNLYDITHGDDVWKTRLQLPASYIEENYSTQDEFDDVQFLGRTLNFISDEKPITSTALEEECPQDLYDSMIRLCNLLSSTHVDTDPSECIDLANDACPAKAKEAAESSNKKMTSRITVHHGSNEQKMMQVNKDDSEAIVIFYYMSGPQSGWVTPQTLKFGGIPPGLSTGWKYWDIDVPSWFPYGEYTFTKKGKCMNVETYEQCKTQMIDWTVDMFLLPNETEMSELDNYQLFVDHGKNPQKYTKQNTLDSEDIHYWVTLTGYNAGKWVDVKTLDLGVISPGETQTFYWNIDIPSQVTTTKEFPLIFDEHCEIVSTGGLCETQTNTTVLNLKVKSISEGGGACLIATATYGSELAPQVQQLREIRDNTLFSTTSGTAFMSTFNQLYYSFAPTISDWERESPLFKEAVKIVITPMLSTLSIMSLADEGSEVEVLGLGISVILLNFGMYIGIPVVAIMKIRK